MRGRALVLFGMLVIALLVGVLVAAAVLLSSAMARNVAEQQELREADRLRVETLELQLDEETGLRGFQLSRDPYFLAPLVQARPRVPIVMKRLSAVLLRVDPSALGALNSERALNARWSAQIMKPALRGAGASSRSFWVAGKVLVDRYRNENARIETSLNSAARGADANSASFVILVTRWTLALVLAIALLFLYYLWVQMRLLRSAELNAEALRRERTVSQTLQKAFLFENLPNMPGLAFDATYVPAESDEYVGGDWYGVNALRDGRVFFTVGDVAGHGTYAAVTMARTRQTILAAAVRESDPAVALSYANDIIRLRDDFFITAVCGYIDLKRGKIVYASAGHVPPLLISPSGLATYLPSRGLPLGFLDDLKCESFERAIEPGATFVFYTDGLVEFERNVLLGEERLARSASAILHESPVLRASALVERTLAHKRQLDDVAVLVIEISAVPAAAPQEVVHS